MGVILRFVFWLVLAVLVVTGRGQGSAGLTDSLVNRFHAAWNANDLEGMLEMLQPDAFFSSPFQLRYTRDTMAATVLLRNPPVIRECTTVEKYSHVEDSLAWSIGDLYCNWYDRDGKPLERDRGATRYTYVFTRKDDLVWKLQMLIFHEECD